ncbi:hypothetical protein IU451_29005 [Nocardia cyriacigeorgica]|uniref:hypothetical protein n=1 Tax=Nocardia cyriacigeorgica TaxID=135487 RepID=UPI0018945C65|nr:hypothetical protein [Nocardia cyriacigeorgica]MBF6326543.1 hypothetical protein [Nocardia cyriacigeorgica]
MADQTPTQLTNEHLRIVSDASHLDCHPDGQVRDMAAELLAARARNVELEEWRARFVTQARRAIDDLDRWNRLYQPSADDPRPDLADLIDRALDDRDSARARVAELENFADRVRAALDGHPRCEIHPDDDVIGCGWKRAVASVQWAVDHIALDAMPASAEHDRAGEIENLRARVAQLEAERDAARGAAGRAYGQAAALQTRVTELGVRVAARDERIAELEAERDRNAVDPEAVADEFGIQGLTVEDGVATLTTAPTTEEARDLVLAMSLALGKMLDDDQATNYIETEIKKAGRPAYVLNVRRAMGQTPHELRRAAEARVAELEAQQGELVGYTVALRAPGRAEPFAGLCLASGTTYDTADHAREVAEQVDGMPAVVRLLAGAEPPEVSDRG